MHVRSEDQKYPEENKIDIIDTLKETYNEGEERWDFLHHKFKADLHEILEFILYSRNQNS